MMVNINIVSVRIVDDIPTEKKHVAYMLQITLYKYKIDADPSIIERRYTHFLNLYNGLKNEYPALMVDVSFPKKVLMGNFDPTLIDQRCRDLDAFMKEVISDSRLREAPVTIQFFHEKELLEAKKQIEENNYNQALMFLETSFKLLNKLYTDRSKVVLCMLCRVVAVAADGGGALAAPVARWAQLALRRYQAVSDSDLLQLYVPLLHSCIAIWDTLGKDKSELVEELNNLRKKGMKVDSAPSLQEAIVNLEKS